MERGHWQAPWWLQPLVVFVVLTTFVVYATFRVFENAHYIADNGAYHYGTPFGNPDLTFLVPDILAAIPVVGVFLTYPAVLILPFVAGFRFTCYYYRKAYYRAFAWTPPACAVPAIGAKSEGGRRRYQGEKGLLVFQNLHRYFLYAALVVLVFNLIDAIKAIWTPNGLYFGLGSLIMIVNVVLLSGYTFGCHALRHLVGGNLDCFSCTVTARNRYKFWQGVSFLNGRHMTWAWVSLVWVAFTDFYIRWLAQNPAATVLGVPA